MRGGGNGYGWRNGDGWRDGWRNDVFPTLSVPRLRIRIVIEFVGIHAVRIDRVSQVRPEDIADGKQFPDGILDGETHGLHPHRPIGLNERRFHVKFFGCEREHAVNEDVVGWQLQSDIRLSGMNFDAGQNFDVRHETRGDEILDERVFPGDGPDLLVDGRRIPALNIPQFTLKFDDDLATFGRFLGMLVRPVDGMDDERGHDFGQLPDVLVLGFDEERG